MYKARIKPKELGVEMRKVGYGDLKKIFKKRVYDAKDKATNASLVALSNHPVTSELTKKPLISPLVSRGNLFGLIGFESFRDPPAELRTAILAKIKLNITRQGKYGLISTLTYPDKNEIDLIPLEWTSESWLDLIENGVPNAVKYLDLSSRVSRSNFGIQVKFYPKEPVNYKGIEYYDEFFNAFKKEVERQVRRI